MSNHIYIPTHSPDDWQRLLADPARHWRTGFSAKAIAHCWESANGFPPEALSLFTHSNVPAFETAELLLALPEHKVFLPPRGGRPSQNDLFVLAKAGDGRLISITVEGKVSEQFDEPLEKWNAAGSPGKTARLNFIKDQLGLKDRLPGSIHYQLLHRTTSAVIEAQRFNAAYAVMIVHSFNQQDLWFDEYCEFLGLFGVQGAEPGKLFFLRETQGIRLFSGWARGSAEFLQV